MSKWISLATLTFYVENGEVGKAVAASIYFLLHINFNIYNKKV